MVFPHNCKIAFFATVLDTGSNSCSVYCAITEAADSLNIIGALKYISHLTERNSLVQSAAEFFVNGRLRAALDQ